MKKTLSLLAITFVFTAFTTQAQAEEETPTSVYVQSVKADLKTDAKMSSASVPAGGPLKRGDHLHVLKKQGLWLNVETDAHNQGWISKLFVDNSKPTTEAELVKELDSDKSLAKTARIRSSSYSASATTRGLIAGNRVREGREKYESDPDAIKRMDSFNLPENELRKFQEAGKLGE